MDWRRIVICSGMGRSGSTWIFNICRELVQMEAQRLGSSSVSLFMNGATLEQFCSMDAFSVRGGLVIKVHRVGQQSIRLITAGHAKMLYTFRDPRDCVLSLLKFRNRSLKDTIRRVEGDLKAHPRFDSEHLLMLQYERSMQNRLLLIEQIARHLGFSIWKDALSVIDVRTNQDASRKICDNLLSCQTADFMSGDHKVDPATHLHHNHILNGQVGGWRSELTRSEQKRVNDHFRPWLTEFGYV